MEANTSNEIRPGRKVVRERGTSMPFTKEHEPHLGGPLLSYSVILSHHLQS